MVETVLSAAVGLLVVNLIVAAVTLSRRRTSGSWLLVILLGPLTGQTWLSWEPAWRSPRSCSSRCS